MEGLSFPKVVGVAFVVALLVGAGGWGYSRYRQAAAPASETSLSGVWLGQYEYRVCEEVPPEQRRPIPSPVTFTLELAQVEGKLTGRIREPNTFGPDPKRNPHLHATIEGVTSGAGEIEFTKTYDGTDGQSHSIRYVGRRLVNSREIGGEWSVGAHPCDRGAFRMRKSAAQ